MVQAVIMAAGKSTRTYPLTLTKPKPLLHIANKPILAHQLDQMPGLVDEAIVIVGYKHKMIREFFGDSYRGISLTYVEQREQLGTGHAAMQAQPYIRERFLLMNGDDLYAREDLEACLQYQYSLLSVEVEDPRQFGVLTVENGLVKDLIEKPEHPTSKLTSVGVYVFDRNIFPILDKIPRSPRGEYEVTDGVRELAHSAEMHYHVSSAYWIPVGFPWSILTANDFLLERNLSERIEGTIEPGVCIEGTVFLGKNSIIRQGTSIQGKLCVGKNCVIGPNSHISGNTSIGNNSSLAMASRVDNSLIEQNVRIGSFCNISHSVVGDGCILHSGVVAMSVPLEGSTVTSVVKGQAFDSGRKQLGAILASGAELQPHVVTYPGIKIAPDTIVDAGTVLREDVSS